MKYSEIAGYGGINATDAAKVAEIAGSIKENGWNGAPILACSLGLVTGSHRFAALASIAEECDAADGEEFDRLYSILESDVAEDVTDEINAYCEREGCGYEEVPFDNLREVFEGTWVEEYKEEIEEW